MRRDTQSFVCVVGRWLDGAFRDQLLLPLVWHQRIHDDRHAVSVQWIDHLSLELP